MNTSEDAVERHAKVKKELTYQEELKRQIDEKKRKKRANMIAQSKKSRV